MSAATQTVRTLGVGAMMAGAAIVAVALAVTFAEASLKQQLIITAALGGAVVVAISRQVMPLVMAGWILLLTYNRQYFSFDGMIGDFGSQGLYWIPADAALAAMVGLWVLELVFQRTPLHPMRAPLPWYLPFLVAGGLSLFVAEHAGWAAAEWLRWAKLGLIVVFLSHHLHGKLWWVCLITLGVAVLLQSALGVLQVTMNTSTGLLSMFTGGGPAGETVVAALGETGRARASGTMAHPNIFGPFLLFLAPAFLALAVGAEDRRVRAVATVVCAASYFGLAGTMSRLPIVLGIAEAGITVVALVALRRVPLGRALSLGAFSTLGLIVFLMAFLDPISDRFSGDLRESFDFRHQYNTAAVAMWKDNPLLGVGLNNFPEHLPEHSPRLAQIVDEMQDGRKTFGLRIAAPVHNVYLLVLAETGIAGLAAILLLLGGALYTGVRASLATHGATQLAAIGLTAGVLGQVMQQTMDFSLWMDPGLITFTIVFCLLASALRSNSTAEAQEAAYE